MADLPLTGELLRKWATLYGVIPIPGESDDELRSRIGQRILARPPQIEGAAVRVESDGDGGFLLSIPKA
jgi:hypothetical protein